MSTLPAPFGECAARGWDYSISVTHDGWRKPVLEQLEGLPDAAWTDLGMEETIFASHRPSGWERHYVVMRRRMRGDQLPLVPHHTVILARLPQLDPDFN